MFTIEELNSWNELFPDCKIRESDLAKPTEPFLTRTLIAYLRKLGFDVTQTYALNVDTTAETSREKRLFQIKLARQVDHFFKITDKSYAFLYYDLLHPTPKKTAHMLGILLNYLYYYNMYKTEVSAIASERLLAHFVVLKDIEKAMQENNRRSEHIAKIEAKLEAMSVEGPAVKAKVDELFEDIINLKELIEITEDHSEKLEYKLEQLQATKRNLKQQIVPDSESHELQTKLQNLHENIAEHNRAQCKAEVELKEFIEHINALHILLQELEDANKIVSPQLLENFKESQLKLRAAKKQAQDAEHQKCALLETIKTQEQQLKACEEILQQSKFEQEKGDKQRALADKEKHCCSMKTQLSSLHINDQNLERQIQEQKDLNNYLVQSSVCIVPHKINLN